MTCTKMFREVFNPRLYVVHDHVARVTKVVYSSAAIDVKSPSDSERIVAWED
jgi:hypothetical protein